MLKPGDMVQPTWYEKGRSEEANGMRLAPDMLLKSPSEKYTDVYGPLTVLAVMPSHRPVDPDVTSDDGSSVLLLSRCGRVGWSLSVVLRVLFS